MLQFSPQFNVQNSVTNRNAIFLWQLFLPFAEINRITSQIEFTSPICWFLQIAFYVQSKFKAIPQCWWQSNLSFQDVNILIIQKLDVDIMELPRHTPALHIFPYQATLAQG